MGNIGRPSTGCFLCRKRRVKCDEGRPGCRNCARLKKPCPGYREPGYGLIRSTLFVSNETDTQSQRSLSTESLPQPAFYRAGSSSSDSDESESAKTDPIVRSQTRSPQRLPPLTYPSGDLTEQAVCYSLTQLDVNSRVLYGNHAFNFLPQILADAGRDSYLYAAMRSVAAVNFANRSPTVDMRDMIELEYARAVSRVTAALADPDQCLRDETLVAVWLLGIRELLAGVNGPQSKSAHQTHVDGTLMLLRLRGEEQFSSPAGRHLYATLLSAMHWKPLFASEEPSQEYLMLESQLSQATTVPEASLRLRSFFHGVTKLRARIRNFLSMQDDASVDKAQVVESYLRAAARLKEKVNGWCTDPTWLPRKVLAEPPQRHLQRNPWTSGTLLRLHCFSSWHAFFHWNRFFVAKACLHAALLDALSTLPKTQTTRVSGRTIDDLILSNTAVLQETVRDFIGQLAYALGDVDENGQSRPIPTGFVSGGGAASEHRGIDVPSTLQVQGPLSYLITLKYLGPGQREAMFLALQRIRAEFCIR
ncbi:hypothetical protein G647_01193 [Cladophialophora carrionii CBS 160.54]|uniref:Zn(2)-C6 fungal-type domain-containing protein n=1 Tax=Cladophialophora carrionii CBS 160.54 TaxID=1279043 RepID=V9DS17_9EURO|nr:uncharacterized protein G647_01193 [Cladophialophora carrionii CBS 160.54]ETI28742.1 hypothetical protein G647_01193 [Cladophialophora carrionii CBS 160.54]